MVLPQVSKSENLQEVGRKIRHYREKKKMSQLELAEAIGVTQNTIYLIETYLSAYQKLVMRIFLDQRIAPLNHILLNNRRQVEQAGAAQPLGFTAADDVVQKAAVVPHTADGTVHARHAARDARALEGRAGRHGAADESVAPAERHFTVGADVEKQVCARQIRQSCGQQTGRNVPADVTRHAGGEAYRHAVQRFASGHCKERLRPERRRGDAAHGVPGEEVLHDGVAGERDLAQGVRRAAAARERVRYQRPDLRPDPLRELVQAVRMLERILDAADDVGPVGRLRVPAAAGRKLRAVRKIVQPHDDGRRAEVDGGGAARAPRPAGGQRHGAGQNRAAGSLRQRDGVAVRRIDPAGEPGHAVDRYAALAAAALSAAGGGDGIARAPQDGQQRLACRQGNGAAPAVLFNLDA